jgi:hypothetical protein
MFGIKAAAPVSAALFWVLIGCGDAPATSEAPLGTLSMPLATIVNGVRYRLTTDTFILSGPIERELQHNGDGSIVFAALPEGDYEVTLQDGWVLERQAEVGFEPVVAELASPNPRAVHIESEQTTTVAWIFQTDGAPVPLEPPGLFQGNLGVVDSSNPGTSIFGGVLANEPSQVEALAGITDINGSLAIEGPVSSLAALASLTIIDEGLSISGTGLSSLEGLENLGEVGGVTITDNLLLPTCAALGLLEQVGIDPADAEISGNDDAGVCP